MYRAGALPLLSAIVILLSPCITNPAYSQPFGVYANPNAFGGAATNVVGSSVTAGVFTGPDLAFDSVGIKHQPAVVSENTQKGGLLKLAALAAPTVTSFSPADGWVGENVTINGTNLASASSITFGGTPATSITSDSATQIVVVVPVDAISGPIAVTTAGGTGASASNFNVIPFTYYEGDVLNQGSVTLADWVKIGRFAAGLDPQPTGLQYEEADCAPKPTGSGKPIGLADWVQAGRYAAGLDQLTPLPPSPP